MCEITRLLTIGLRIKVDNVFFGYTGLDGAVVMLSANGLVGNGFASRYRLQPRAGFQKPSG